MKDLYAELGLEPAAGTADIRTAFRRAALAAHPDKGGSDEGFHAITLAFEVLSCPAARALYDRSRGLGAPPRARDRRKLRAARSGEARAMKLRMKRPAAPHAAAHDGVKRPRLAADLCPPDVSAVRELQLELALDGLRGVIQSMKDESPSHARAAIESLSQDVRAELLVFMERRRKDSATGSLPPRGLPQEISLPGARACGIPKVRSTSVRTIRNTSGPAYQAQLRIRHLRLHTRILKERERALLYQTILAQVGDAIAAAGGAVWDAPDNFCQTVDRSLELHRTSANELGLTVHIYMRADRLIDRRRAITSPCLPLWEAVALHARLLRAQRSWESLKAEWVPLLQQTRRARGCGRSAQDASGLAMEARLGFLERRLAGAARGVARALDRRRRGAAKRRQGQARRQRGAAAVGAAPARCLPAKICS